MSNFSSIGFAVQTEEDFKELVQFCFDNGQKIQSSDGTYLIYTDSSGAELYGQLNLQNEVIGMNPHFKGKSKRKVCLTETYLRPESELDGSFHCWADPQKENDPESGACPFVFDVPNYKTLGQINYPTDFEIQLSAFAQEIDVYDSEEAFSDKQNPIVDNEKELKFASQSFVPSGLFSEKEHTLPQATGFFAGIIREWKILTNENTKEDFYWLLVDTLGGEVDIVYDPKLASNKPKIGGVAQGIFWLSGKLINPPFQDDIVSEKKSFWKKIFG
ncbi:MAG: hypothetical protein ABIP79_06355 [Chitinophagaceae bacterium]